MRILYLVPSRAVTDPNTITERDTLIDAGHEVVLYSIHRYLKRPWLPTKIGRIAQLIIDAPKYAEKIRPDAVMCRDLDTLAAGVRVKKRTGARLVYWPHDSYSLMIESDVSRFVYNYTVKHERRLMPFVDRFLASNIGTIDWLWKQNPTIDPIFPTLVMPCRDAQPMFVPPPNNRTLCYFGTLHKNRFIKEMVMAMTELDARLVIAGPRTNDLYDWVKKQADGKRVIFLGHISGLEVMFETRKSDIVVSMLNPADRCLRIGLANKVFDALSVGRAAIGTRGTATGELIEKIGIGPTAAYNIDSYIEAVHELLSQDLKNLGRRAYEAGRSRYNWKTEGAKLVSVFAEISK